VTLQKYFSHTSTVILLFSNPTHETKTGIANKCQELLISNPPAPTKRSTQSTEGVKLCYAIYQPQETMQKCWAKTNLLNQTKHVLTFLHLIFNLQDHVLSTSEWLLGIHHSTESKLQTSYLLGIFFALIIPRDGFITDVFLMWGIVIPDRNLARSKD
jgi:hypothetical protein